MRLEKKFGKKFGKKFVTLTLAAIMAVGGCLSVFAATTFTVSSPSLSRLAVDNYVISGSTTCTSDGSTSTNYYLMDKVYAETLENSIIKTYQEPAYGYGTASAMKANIPVSPYYKKNTGWYNGGSGLVLIGSKTN